MTMKQMMAQCSHIDDHQWMIQKMFRYSHTYTIEYGPKDEATDDDDLEDDSSFIC